jgi:hypothetical protein
LIAVGLGLLVLLGAAGAGVWYVVSHHGGRTPPVAPTATPAAPLAPTAATVATAPPAATEPPAAATTEPNVAEATQPPLATLPPTVPRTPVAPPEARTPKPEAPTAAPEGGREARGYSHLDAEEPPLNGAEVGAEVAGGYRSGQGQESTGFGTRRQLNRRPRSPRDLRPIEMAAVATLRHLMNAETAYHKKEGRYGALAQLVGRYAFLDVLPRGDSFQRKGYRFDLSLTGDDFEVTATPMGLGGRAFKGDSNGFILDAND